MIVTLRMCVLTNIAPKRDKKTPLSLNIHVFTDQLPMSTFFPRAEHVFWNTMKQNRAQHFVLCNGGCG